MSRSPPLRFLLALLAGLTAAAAHAVEVDAGPYCRLDVPDDAVASLGPERVNGASTDFYEAGAFGAVVVSSDIGEPAPVDIPTRDARRFMSRLIEQLKRKTEKIHCGRSRTEHGGAWSEICILSVKTAAGDAIVEIMGAVPRRDVNHFVVVQVRGTTDDGVIAATRAMHSFGCDEG